MPTSSARASRRRGRAAPRAADSPARRARARARWWCRREGSRAALPLPISPTAISRSVPSPPRPNTTSQPPSRAGVGRKRRGVARLGGGRRPSTSKPPAASARADLAAARSPRRRPPPEAGFQIRSAGRVTVGMRRRWRSAAASERSLKKSRRRRLGRDPEMPVGALGGDPAARRALQEAFLDQERLVDVLERAAVLADRGGDRLDAGGAAAGSARSAWSGSCGRPRRSRARRPRAASSARRAAARVDARRRPSTCAKSRTRRSRRLAMRGVPRLRRAISAPPSASSGMPSRRAERARICARSIGAVEVEPVDDAEAGAQRRRDQPGAGGGADQREARQVDLDASAPPGPWPSTRSTWKSSMRGVEDLLDRRPAAGGSRR